MRVKGTLDWGAGVLTFSRATIAMDGNEGTGALALDTTKAIPSFDGTLAFDTLDLSRYLLARPRSWRRSGRSALAGMTKWPRPR